MKFTALQENLQNALKTVSKAVPSKPQLPILGTILCEVVNGEVVLSATDLYMGVRVRVPASIETEATIAIPARTFVDTISVLGAGKLELELKEQTLHIKSEKTKTTIQCQPDEDFPAFPDIEGEKVTVKLDTLKAVDTKLGFVTSGDQARLVLTTILFQPNNNSIEVVATDGFRLGRITSLETSITLEVPAMIPAKAISEVVRIAEQQQEKEVSFTISQQQKQVFFTIGDTIVYVRLVEGDFPPYQKILPDSFASQLSVDGGELLNHLKQAQVMAREVSNIISLEVAEGHLVVAVSGAAQGTFSAKIMLDESESKPEEGFSIAFNSKYLLDYLNKNKPERIIFKFNDSLKPAMITDAEDETYQYVVMPFRMNQA
jgi:DNA polymerase-3 subunit beta